VSTMQTHRRPYGAAGSSSAWELARLLFNWLVAGAAIVLIISLFLLTRSFPRETVPILISAFAMLGIGLAGFWLWALAVGLPEIRRTFYGPIPMWTRRWRQKSAAPWFDHNGTMLWQRDGRGKWVRKVDSTSGLAGQQR
jgi:hypothetical protein